VALAIAAVALFASDPVYRRVVIGAAIWFALGLLWFAARGRPGLVAASEEAFALRERGER